MAEALEHILEKRCCAACVLPGSEECVLEVGTITIDGSTCQTTREIRMRTDASRTLFHRLIGPNDTIVINVANKDCLLSTPDRPGDGQPGQELYVIFSSGATMREFRDEVRMGRMLAQIASFNTDFGLIQ